MHCTAFLAVLAALALPAATLMTFPNRNCNGAAGPFEFCDTSGLGTCHTMTPQGSTFLSFLDPSASFCVIVYDGPNCTGSTRTILESSRTTSTNCTVSGLQPALLPS
ncbi:hypothetical protein AURDEDRAFT_166545 [Auricularia subglabra TFB-10046 SS5]|nr:hypothetical protein AURDEDRAFT_166545 [Auricularia subglabra TFB-10046 SS5]